MDRATLRVETKDGMLPKLRHHTGPVLIGLGIAALLVVQVAAVWPFTVDDAYITLRYARQFAAGHGPIWQPEGPRAEGYSTFLWMVLLAGVHVLRLDALTLAKALGVAATLATLGLAAWWAARLVPRDLRPTSGNTAAPALGAAAIAALALASDPRTAVHAVSGMETALFALLLLVLAALCGEVVSAAGGRGVGWLGPAALALGLTRPEGNIAAALALATTGALLPAAQRKRLALGCLAGYVVPAIAYFLWRWDYYGALLPLPFYIKLAGRHGFPGAVRVWGYISSAGLHLGLLLAFALVRPPRALWPALAAAAGVLVFFLFPAHLMGFHARYLAPLTPLSCVCVAVGAGRLAAWLPARGWVAAARAPAAAWGIAALASLSLLSDATRVVIDRRLYAAGLERAHVTLGRQLAVLPRGTLAIADAGAVPYLSDWRTIDLLGLNERHIALTQDHDPGYALAQHPDVVVLTSADPDRLVPFAWDRWEVPLYRACLARGMSVVARYRFHAGYHLIVLMSPEARIARAPAREAAGGPLGERPLRSP